VTSAGIARRSSGGATRWHLVAQLFDEALQLPTSERQEWLERACPDDPALRDEVARMLVAQRRADGILDLPALPTVHEPRASTPERPLEQRFAEAIGERYQLEGEIGRGGMAVVYLARERKHARRVVIKVLRPEVAASFGRYRFEREVHIAAQLAHPHIVGLLDSGESAGLRYYVMPYVEGETLRARLQRERTLPLRSALVLLRDVADALSHAHREGVVHRDLKPENVLCAGEHAYLLDFGIAKLRERLSGDVHVTRHGFAIGTPAYMAPEQREGSAATDHRADLFAWGLLAHEMLTGTLPPVHGPDALDGRTDLPPPLVTIVRACLARDARRRPAAASVLVATLDALVGAGSGETGGGTWEAAGGVSSRRPRRLARLAALVAIGVASIVGAAYLWRSTAVPAPLPGPVAVAALVNETGDSSLDSWGRMAGDWMTQGLQEAGVTAVVPWPTALAASERLRAERANGRVVDALAFLGEETDARAVVTGTYYLTGDSLRFHVEVTSARDAKPLGVLPPVVVPRDSGQLAVRLLRDRLMGTVAILADDRIVAVPDVVRRPPTFDAYRAFDHALQRFLAQEYGASAGEFREAQALDSTFLVPLLYAATAYWNTGDHARADSMLQALRPQRAALSAYHRGWSDFLEAMLVSDGPRALESIRLTAALAPQSRAAYDLARVSLEMDRPHEAREVLDRLSPDRGDMRGWSSYWTQRTHALHLLGEHARELEDARELRARFPARRVALALEARALAAMGRDAAIDTLLAGARALPPTTYWSQGAALVVAGEELVAHGRAAEGRKRLEQAVDWFTRQLAVTPGDRAHREWLASALYDLGRWQESSALFASLRRDFPERLKYRGLAALAAARVGRADADSLLGAPAPHEVGTHTAYRARLAAVRGDPARAAALLADATRAGVGALPWLHAEGHMDLALLAGVRELLPVSVR